LAHRTASEIEDQAGGVHIFPVSKKISTGRQHFIEPIGSIFSDIADLFPA
jgi:hypothetical protein